MDKTIGVIGAGAWGTAIAKVIADKGYTVSLWSFEREVTEAINTAHENMRYLPGVKLPESLSADTDLAKVAAGKEYLILASPSLYLLPTVKSLLTVPDIREGRTLIGVLTKGFIPTQRGPRLALESLEDYLPGSYKGNVVYISGPSHAEEVSRGKLTGLISASLNGKNSIKFRELLLTKSLMVFSSFDVVGVQVCAAVKNVIAIAYGVLDALKSLAPDLGDNTESLLLAAGLNEIQTFGIAMGATHPETFTSIAGVGDLDVTCRSQYGRNRRFGRSIILENKLTPFRNIDDLIEHIQEIGYLPEGIVACRYTMELARGLKLRLPIVEGVYRILNREVEPLEAIEYILTTITGTPFEGTYAEDTAPQ